jgi:hypothetical protein
VKNKDNSFTVMAMDRMTFTQRMMALQGALSLLERVKFLEMVLENERQGQVAITNAPDVMPIRNAAMVDLVNEIAMLVIGEPVVEVVNGEPGIIDDFLN